MTIVGIDSVVTRGARVATFGNGQRRNILTHSGQLIEPTRATPLVFPYESPNDLYPWNGFIYLPVSNVTAYLCYGNVVGAKS